MVGGGGGGLGGRRLGKAETKSTNQGPFALRSIVVDVALFRSSLLAVSLLPLPSSSSLFSSRSSVSLVPFFFQRLFPVHNNKKKEKKNCRSVLSLLSFFSNNFFMFHSVFFVLWVCVRVCVCVFYVEFRASYLLPETFPGCEVAERYFLGSVPFVSFLSIQRSSSTLSSSCFFSSSSSGFDW